jgi:hypothetical protein
MNVKPISPNSEKLTSSDPATGNSNCEAGNDTSNPPLVVSGAGERPAADGQITIPFPTGSPICDWTGRNGTFAGKAIWLDIFENLDPKDNIIRIRPIGKRGVSNGLISFPANIIPQVIKWLENMNNISD